MRSNSGLDLYMLRAKSEVGQCRHCPTGRAKLEVNVQFRLCPTSWAMPALPGQCRHCPTRWAKLEVKETVNAGIAQDPGKVGNEWFPTPCFVLCYWYWRHTYHTLVSLLYFSWRLTVDTFNNSVKTFNSKPIQNQINSIKLNLIAPDIYSTVLILNWTFWY